MPLAGSSIISHFIFVVSPVLGQEPKYHYQPSKDWGWQFIPTDQTHYPSCFAGESMAPTWMPFASGSILISKCRLRPSRSTTTTARDQSIPTKGSGLLPDCPYFKGE